MEVDLEQLAELGEEMVAARWALARALVVEGSDGRVLQRLAVGRALPELAAYRGALRRLTGLVLPWALDVVARRYAGGEVDEAKSGASVYLLAALERWDPARGRLLPWLRLWLRAGARSAVRQLSVVRGGSCAEFEEDSYSEEGRSPEDRLDQARRADAVAVQMRQLSTGQTELVREVVWRGTSYASMARAQGTTRQALHSRLRRVLRTLREGSVRP